MDRFGIRRVLVSALLVMAMAAALTTRMSAPWQLDLLWGVAVGSTTGAMASVLAATIANRWFVTRRGLVMGLLSASTATGQIQFLPILAFVATVAGWRAVSWTVALVALALVPILLLFMRNAPEDIGLRPYGATTDRAVEARQNPVGAAFRGLTEATRSGNFWLLAGSFFICGASTNGLIGTHLIPAAMDHGMSEVTAASLLAMMGVFDIVGTTLSGWLTDRWDSRRLLCWYYGLRGLSLFLLPYALRTPAVALVVFAVFYGLDWVATVPPTATLTREIFGPARAGVVYGWIFASHQLGASTAAFGAGLIRTTFGDYLPAFVLAGSLCLCAAGFVLRLPRPVRVPLPVRGEAVAAS
jgi:predicted MFS family arabinose efflux permease